MLVTVTSKNQITIPVELVRKLGIKKGQKLVVSEKGREIRIRTAEEAIDRLAGSLKKYNTKNTKYDKEKTRDLIGEYFKRKYEKTLH